MQKSNTLWTQPTKSGLGDRCCDLLFVYSYATMFNSKLYTSWPQFEIKKIDMPHRKTDIQIDNVLKYLNFPEDISFKKPDKVDKIFNFYVGGGNTAKSFHEKYIGDKFSLSKFNEVVEKCSQEFNFCNEIKNYLLTLPESFISLHIRRGDKVREGTWNDGGFINYHEVEHLDLITRRVIDFYSKLGYKHLFICGDENDKTQVFLNYANSKNFKTFTTPKMPKWKETYFDIATMTKSKIVITSQRYSSFAKFPTLIGKGKFLTTYELEKII
tara:strand:- start:6754 stop:7563 length:810 start_codon:yes stop_codon:yes gene_type:complete